MTENTIKVLKEDYYPFMKWLDKTELELFLIILDYIAKTEKEDIPYEYISEKYRHRIDIRFVRECVENIHLKFKKHKIEIFSVYSILREDRMELIYNEKYNYILEKLRDSTIKKIELDLDSFIFIPNSRQKILYMLFKSNKKNRISLREELLREVVYNNIGSREKFLDCLYSDFTMLGNIFTRGTIREKRCYQYRVFEFTYGKERKNLF